MGPPLHEINKMYDEIENKDMPRQEFVKRMQALTSQAGVDRDLGKILAAKRKAANEKRIINTALEGRN